MVLVALHLRLITLKTMQFYHVLPLIVSMEDRTFWWIINRLADQK